MQFFNFFDEALNQVGQVATDAGELLLEGSEVHVRGLVLGELVVLVRSLENLLDFLLLEEFVEVGPELLHEDL